MRSEQSSASPATGGTDGPDPTTGTVRAITQDRYGRADVLRLDEVPRPVAGGDHDVLVRVAAAGLDRGAWHAMTGLPHWFGSTGEQPVEVLSVFGPQSERMRRRAAPGGAAP